MWLLLAFGCAIEPTFSNVQAEVLTPSCSFSSCHGGGAGGLTLDGSAEDRGRLVGVPSSQLAGTNRVNPGDPDGSYLMMKLEGAADIVDDAMPPPNGGLDPEKIALVRAWIEAGAGE